MKSNNILIKKIMNFFFLMFPMIFQSLMGPRTQGVTIPNGTTQENSYPKLD